MQVFSTALDLVFSVGFLHHPKNAKTPTDFRESCFWFRFLIFFGWKKGKKLVVLAGCGDVDVFFGCVGLMS